MSCWPPCSGWCECVGNECRQAPLKPNAVRIRTNDGRYLRAINGPATYLGYLGPTSNALGTWDTFLIDQPMAWPVHTGDLIVLRAVDDTWRPLTDVLVRVDHGVLTLPKKGKKDPQLVTYQFGGSDLSVLVSSPLSPGYPAYTANDPGEWTFTITKIAGGNPAAAGTPINTGDQVTFSFFSRNPVQPERFWRLRDDTSLRRVDSDAAPGGPAATVFTVEFSEVRPDLGWRPAGDMHCRQCASVTAVVTRRDTGAPVADWRAKQRPTRARSRHGAASNCRTPWSSPCSSLAAMCPRASATSTQTCRSRSHGRRTASRHHRNQPRPPGRGIIRRLA